MPTDIKNLLDSIIDKAETKFTPQGKASSPAMQPVTFDAGNFREKLSMYVLKDIICAMMHDETKDLDGMIDQSIQKHIHDNYGGSCYGYLCKARDTLNSPMMSDIVQEIDEKTQRITAKVCDRQDDSFVKDEETLKDSLKEVENFDEFRAKLKKVVSDRVVDDVAKVITTGNDAPVFDKIDEKLAEKKDVPDDTTNESMILRMCGTIVTEAAMNGVQMSREEGLNRAIIQYCIAEMDYLFKQDPSARAFRKYS